MNQVFVLHREVHGTERFAKIAHKLDLYSSRSGKISGTGPTGMTSCLFPVLLPMATEYPNLYYYQSATHTPLAQSYGVQTYNIKEGCLFKRSISQS